MPCCNSCISHWIPKHLPAATQCTKCSALMSLVPKGTTACEVYYKGVCFYEEQLDNNYSSLELFKPYSNVSRQTKGGLAVFSCLVWGLLLHTNHSSVHLSVWAWGGEVFCCGSHTCNGDEQNMTSGWGRFETEVANVLHWKQGVKIWCFFHCTTGGGNSWCMSGEIPALTKSIEKPFTDYRRTSSLTRRKI